MAKELDGLPDLWEGLQRLLRALRSLWHKDSRPASAEEAWRGHKPQTAPQAARKKPRREPPAPETAQLIKSAQQQAQALESSAKPPVSAPALSPPPLVRRLRNRRFIEQAIIVKVILDKPVALRRGIRG